MANDTHTQKKGARERERVVGWVKFDGETDKGGVHQEEGNTRLFISTYYVDGGLCVCVFYCLVCLQTSVQK